MLSMACFRGMGAGVATARRAPAAIVGAMLVGLLAACGDSDAGADPIPDAGDGSVGGDDGTGGSGPASDGDASMDPDPPDPMAECRPGTGDPQCPEICPERCNDLDDDCDGETDEGADDTDCAVDNAVSVCTRGLCILSACDDGYRDCDGAQANGCEADIGTIDDCGACGNACQYDNTGAVCVDGECQPGDCVDPYVDCSGDDGLCETFGGTLTDCGGCGVPCGAPTRATPICMDGACVVDECLGNFGDCNVDPVDGCELRLNTPEHCGSCGIPCAFAGSVANCDNGACIVDACVAGFGDCDGSPITACDSLDTDADCGGCGKQCAANALANVDTASCQSAVCAVVCAAGYGDCDSDPFNGCETPLAGVNNCSACGAACAPDHAIGDCAAGSCQVALCDEGWADCNGNPDDGCETDTGRPENCGGCGVQCDVIPDPIGCNGAICTGILCAEGQADCDGNDTCESDLSSDATCGSCNVRCEFDGGIDGHGSVACAVQNSVPGQRAWGCEVSCTDGFADCDGDYRNGCEVDLTDLDHCGGCGDVCTKTRATPTCENRRCEVDTCNLDWGDCDGDDLDCETQLNSATDCGSCDNGCDFPFSASVCGGSPGNRQCVLSQCIPIEHEDCDGAAGNGCEIDTRSDAANCNGCGNDCTTGPQVQSGACIDSACVFACAPDYRDCTPGAGCETNLLSVSTCGSCGNDCFALPAVASATCRPGGGNPACEIVACQGGFGDCNGEPSDGCEIATVDSELHCGGCDGDPGHQPCTGLANVDASSCNSGSCGIDACAADFEDCDGNSANGCELDMLNDPPCCDPQMDDDNDGFDNCTDQCPTDPDKSVPGVCGCFVADTDSDGDGAPGCIDACSENPKIQGDCEPQRKALTIAGGEVASAQNDFPVLVRFANDSDVAAYADPTGRDIRFEDALGNALAFERESYDSDTGALVAWVKVDLTGADQTVYVYYGDGDLVEKSSAAAVWTSDYDGVWHLENLAGLTDSSGGGHTGSNGGATSVAGVIGQAADFTNAQHIGLGAGALSGITGPGTPGIATFSFWAENDVAADQSVFGADENVHSVDLGSRIFNLHFPQSDGNIYWDADTESGFNRLVTASGGRVGPPWSHWAVMMNNATGEQKIYYNGSLLAEETDNNHRLDRVAGRFTLGAERPALNQWDGRVDEFRVSPIERSVDWLATEFNNQRPGATFLMVGVQESL